MRRVGIRHLEEGPAETRHGFKYGHFGDACACVVCLWDGEDGCRHVGAIGKPTSTVLRAYNGCAVVSMSRVNYYVNLVFGLTLLR